MNKKFIAKILPPDSYYDADEYLDHMDNFHVIPSRRNNGYHTQDIDYIIKFLDYLEAYDTEDEAVDTFAFHDINATREQIHDIMQAIFNNERDEAIAMLLSIVEGVEYKAVPIRGCCQGDYATLVCPKDADRKSIDFFEAVWFGTGTHYEVLELQDDGSYLQAYENVSAKWRDEDIRCEVAKDNFVDEDDVGLMVFDHYEKIAKYKEVC